MGIEISIIVPIYNLEQYLPKCIDSILAQTFTNFELILINDGSTDRSGKICDDYAKIDDRVIVFHKENGGIASSRNAGLELAKGRYIGFVDNDDYINKFMFETLYKHATENFSDIVVCDFLKVGEDQGVSMDKIEDYKVEDLNNIEALHQLYTANHLTFICPWNKLYKREIFEGIKFELNYISDDETVAHKLLYKSTKITYIHKKLYYYVQRNESLSNQTFNIKKIDMVYALKGREAFFREHQLDELHQKAIKHFMEKFFWYYYLVKKELVNVDKELKDLKRTFDESLFLMLKHNEISWKQKVMCILFSVNPSIFELIKNARFLNSK